MSSAWDVWEKKPHFWRFTVDLVISFSCMKMSFTPLKSHFIYLNKKMGKKNSKTFGIVGRLRSCHESKNLKNSLENSPKNCQQGDVGSVKGHKKSWLVELVWIEGARGVRVPWAEVGRVLRVDISIGSQWRVGKTYHPPLYGLAEVNSQGLLPLRCRRSRSHGTPSISPSFPTDNGTFLPVCPRLVATRYRRLRSPRTGRCIWSRFRFGAPPGAVSNLPECW